MQTLHTPHAGTATAPGDIIRRDVLPALGMTVRQAAEELGVSRQALHRLIVGSAALTPEMAVRLERLTGAPARRWLALQEEIDLRRAQTDLEDDLAVIPRHDLAEPVARAIERAASRESARDSTSTRPGP